uniref:Uncharacterized protein n=1 Tax=Tetranychus urticae TaxID=32264 RepID=T1KG91_TETUR
MDLCCNVKPLYLNYLPLRFSPLDLNSKYF